MMGWRLARRQSLREHKELQTQAGSWRSAQPGAAVDARELLEESVLTRSLRTEHFRVHSTLLPLHRPTRCDRASVTQANGRWLRLRSASTAVHGGEIASFCQKLASNDLVSLVEFDGQLWPRRKGPALDSQVPQ
eukprot:1009097-Rhodomonas_salina.1